MLVYMPLETFVSPCSQIYPGRFTLIITISISMVGVKFPLSDRSEGEILCRRAVGKKQLKHC